ncbi:TRAP transporter large permease [Acuticoccus sp.]|uniref:TRAP transporter large permease n=1 Tax=Acuticoccus sp. TaxID=1904378 RepID=UPI003B52B35A
MSGSILSLLLVLILIGFPIGFSLMVMAGVSMWVAGIDLMTLPIQLFRGTANFVILAVPLFILMGELMSATTIAQRLIDLAAALVGWLRGGLAHANVVTSMFMAEMSGSAVADAAAMSKIFVPGMERAGYPRTYAAAVTSATATLGIIIPPSIPMVLYGVTTNTSIRDLFIAGLVPGLLLGAAFMVTCYIFAVREGHPVDERFEVRRLGVALRRAFVPLLIPVLVIGGLIGGVFTPTEAAGVGVALALLFGLVLSRELTARRLYDILVLTARQSAVVMMLVAGSAALSLFLASQRIPQAIAELLQGFGEQPLLAILLINLFLLGVGMFLQAAAAIIVVVPILLPLALQIGLDPVHFGIIVCLNLGIGQQTPPVATVMLTVCSVTGLRIQDVLHYGKWLLLAMFVVLMIVSYVPQTAIWFR